MAPGGKGEKGEGKNITDYGGGEKGKGEEDRDPKQH